MPERKRETIYQEVTDRVIAELERGRVPWAQPWGAAKAALGLPKNAATGRTYSGINILILRGAVIERCFPAQTWLTFRQALAMGGHVRDRKSVVQVKSVSVRVDIGGRRIIKKKK